MPPCEINEGEPCKQCHKRVTGVHVNTVATRARNKNPTVVQQQDEVRGDFIYPGQRRKIRPKERPPLRLRIHEQDPRKRNAPLSRVLSSGVA